MDVSKLMATLSELLEKDKTSDVPLEMCVSRLGDVMDRLSVGIEKGKTRTTRLLNFISCGSYVPPYPDLVKMNTIVSELKAEMGKLPERRDLVKITTNVSELKAEMAHLSARPDFAKIKRNLSELSYEINRLVVHNDCFAQGVGNMPILSAKMEDKRCHTPQLPDFVVGYEFSFNYIKEKLLSGGEPVIVITGGGGYGKTTLVTKLCHDEQLTGKFKDIIFMPGSTSMGLMAVIQQIMNHLGLEISDPETQTEDDAVQVLQQLLGERAKQNPILLVLDDIWYGAESILLDKFVNNKIPNCILLVTSRSELPGIGCSHRLKGLEHEDTVQLLRRHLATPSNQYHPTPPDEIIEKVAERCKGSPLALTFVGMSLRGKSKAAWIRKLEGRSLFGDDDDDDMIHTYLSSPMYSLKGFDGTEELERVKKCFLDLGSFPEDHRICVAALVDMWSVLYGIDADGEDAIAAIIELSARNLLDLITTREDISLGDGYYTDMHVMQTDVLLRELIIYLNSKGPVEERERLNLNIRRNNLPEWFRKEQKQSFKARLVSICTDEDFSSPWPDLELPAAEVLVFNFKATKYKECYTLPNFIKKMVNLKTLIITNNGPFPVEVRNFHLIASLINLKKIRLENIKIDSHTMTTDFCFLDNLQKIFVVLCDISEEIQESGVRINQMLPKLEEIDISYCSSLKKLPYAICDAKTLKKICITNCHNLSELPEEIGNLTDLQVLRLNACTDLQTLPSSIEDVENLRFLDISNCTSIVMLPFGIWELQQLKELRLSWCSSLSSLPSPISRLKQLECLIVDEEQVVNFRRYFKNSSTKLKLKVAAQDRSLNFMG